MEKIKERKEEISLKWFLEIYKRFPVIAVTWPAGVWKSTITQIIAKNIWWKILTELPEDNPFLKVIKEILENPNRPMINQDIWWNNQNLFLATDSWQIAKWYMEAKNQPIIFDFSLVQPYIFADMKLSWTWLDSFKQIFNHQFNSLPKPDLIIEIKSETDEIINRLEKRWKYIDDQIIKDATKLNWYYKNWIVSEFFNIDWTYVVELDNTKDLNPIELEQMVKDFIKNFIRKSS
jgi:deoxyadenosine/deoxycytidine kinase